MAENETTGPEARWHPDDVALLDEYDAAMLMDNTDGPARARLLDHLAALRGGPSASDVRALVLAACTDLGRFGLATSDDATAAVASLVVNASKLGAAVDRRAAEALRGELADAYAAIGEAMCGRAPEITAANAREWLALLVDEWRAGWAAEKQNRDIANIAIDQRNEARAALEQFGDHARPCPRRAQLCPPSVACTCGLDAALDAARRVVRQAPGTGEPTEVTRYELDCSFGIPSISPAEGGAYVRYDAYLALRGWAVAAQAEGASVREANAALGREIARQYECIAGHAAQTAAATERAEQAERALAEARSALEGLTRGAGAGFGEDALNAAGWQFPSWERGFADCLGVIDARIRALRGES